MILVAVVLIARALRVTVKHFIGNQHSDQAVDNYKFSKKEQTRI